ncbi:hypothetical protein [Neptuniibacter halophilus]|uniref:hypothetical protein n=1 Tax=Neptuniibacter halophilus TaxID=651666 RepID=UPI002572C253|nr:hypothetical protein [Neptuniibacter halophilus]
MNQQAQIETAKFYSVGEKDILTATSIAEAVQEYVDDRTDWDSPISEHVKVQGWDPACLTESSCFEFAVEHLIECLNENYGAPDGDADYDLSEKAKALFNEFAKQVAAEYPVWGCERTGDPITVKVSDYVEVEEGA